MGRMIGKMAAVIVAAAVVVSAAPGRSSDDAGRVQLSPSDTDREIIEKAASVRPSSRQVAWQRTEYAMFVHFGINTFTNREWGDGREDPALFNPSALDADQWAQTAREAGMKVLVLTAKHHDGFCLWPTAQTDHGVASSPWRGGRGDVVAEAAAACRRAGIKFGVYLSPWDRHEPSYGTAAYNDYYKAQLRELLTGYGEVAEVWMDGAGMGDSFQRMKDLYDWDGYFDLVRELQPGAVISINGPDVRWVGNEAGDGRASEWSVVPESFDPVARDLGSFARLREAADRGEAIRWYPSQVDVSIRPGWFYHRREDLLVRPLRKLVDIYFDSVGANSQLLLNVPPDRRGLIAERDARRLRELGRVLTDTFADNLVAGAVARGDGERAGFPAANAADGDIDTYWTPDDWTEAASLEFELRQESTFNVARLMEDIRRGQRIESFVVEAEIKGEWRRIAAGTTVGYQRLLRFPEVRTNRVRVRFTGFRVAPTLAEFGLFDAP